MSTLAEVARESDEAVRRARSQLVTAVRDASRSGMTQQQIGREIGRSQPEVSRLLRFHGTSPLAREVIRSRRVIIDLVRQAGGRDIRVFGSLATGTDVPDSDVDLLFDMTIPLGLMSLGRLEEQISDVLGAPVDLVPEQVLRPDVRDRVLAEAVAL